MDKVEHSCKNPTCELPDDGEMVSCDTCLRWWHYKCANFNPSLFDTATPWFCRSEDCDKVAGSRNGEKSDEEDDAPAQSDSDELSNTLDALIKAAKVAQSTVDQRDSEILSLKAEMEQLKSKLVAASSAPVQSEVKFKGTLKLGLVGDRLAEIRQIDERHKEIVSKSPVVSHSTPLNTKVGNSETVHVEEKASRQDSSVHQSDMANLLTILNRNQVQELPSFSGHDRNEWPYFESVYRSTTSEGRYSERENVARLRKALTGEAFQLVSDRLRYSSDAEAIMGSLRAIYGREDVLVHSLTSNLLKLPSLTSGSDMKLRLWAVSLNGFVADIHSMNLDKELDNNYVLTDLSSKLSTGLYREWQSCKFNKPQVNLEDFAAFLTEKLYNLPPDLMKTTKTSANEKASGSSSTRRVLTHRSGINAVHHSCLKCGSDDHPLYECSVFKNLSVEERQTFAKSKQICFKCLDPVPHRWRNCAQGKRCNVNGCSKQHHCLLHPSTSTSTLSSVAPPFVTTPQVHSSHLEANAPILFKVVPIRLYGNNDKTLDTFAFLDDGSAITMIEKDVSDYLELEGEPEKLSLQWTKGICRVEDSLRTSLCVSGINKRKRHTLKGIYSVKGLELPSQDISVEALKKKYEHLKDLPLPQLNKVKPTILLGLDQAKLLVGSKQRSGKDNEPHAVKTLLGWTVFGMTNSEDIVSCTRAPSVASVSYFHGVGKQDEELHDFVKKHFSTEEFGVRPPSGNFVSKNDSRALEVLERTICRVENQYEIGLLWDRDEVTLPDSYPLAEKRLISLEKSLLKQPKLLEWMNEHMRDQLAKGYVRIATDEELERNWDRVWYAPIFVVVNKNKFPPKPRVVADVAAKVGGVSLNSHLLKGPDNLVPLHAGLFKFRERLIAVNADVREMFHRIKINEADQQCQRILWRNGDPSRKPTVYIMQVMMFGPRCSPVSAQFVKNYHVNIYKEKFPEAVDGLVNRTYVDDYFNSHDTVEEAVAVSRDAIKICKEMNFDLVGFQSNSKLFLSQIPEDNVKPSLVSMDPNECENYVTKILGMFWQPSSDMLIYQLNDDENFKKVSDPMADISKRDVLRTIMRIFDPLGLISCLIIRGRAILQEIWREGLEWDEPISGSLKRQWLDFVHNLRQVENIKVPRSYTSCSPDSAKKKLVVFVDASEKAFAAVSYWRFEMNGRVEIAIAMAKAKVAPVKKLSVPRLELQAAVLGVGAAETVMKLHSIQAEDVMFLPDSRTVLAWISSSTYKFPSFVAVRVGEILETSNPSQWWYIRSADNVADDGTRWADDLDSSYSARWFEGPEFLKLPQNDWPISPGKSSIVCAVSEISPKLQIHLHAKRLSFNIYDEFKPRFLGRWFSGVRVLAFLLRFRDRLRKRPIERTSFVTPSEILRAQDWLFRKIQQDAFSEEIECLRSKGVLGPSNSLSGLSPFIDDEGTLRISSRAQNAKLSYAARNPAILPKHHPLVDLLIKHYHEANLHMGTETTISDIRETAWIINIRVAVLRVQSRCYMCKRLKAKAAMPLMGQLPEGRLAFDMRPFTHVGVDSFGPMHVKFGRGTTKRYGMIFTCLSFRAVHIEVLNDLSMDQCIMGVRRFLIHRVVTKFIYSDNGLNFVGTSNRLEKDARDMENSLSEYCAKYDGIVWRFIPAYSPWMGGAWERLIRSIKNSIEFTLRGVVPRDDVLVNALLEAQAQINRRPLTHLPVNPEDPRPLTPNSILFGDSDRDITAPGVFSANDQWSRLYSRRAQHLMKEFTRRWYTEYLPEITRRSKWHKVTSPLKVDSIVLVIEPGEVRAAWRMGRVTSVYPGPDGVVRVADVRLANGTILPKRSVGRLAVLDIESSHTAFDEVRDVISPNLSHINL